MSTESWQTEALAADRPRLHTTEPDSVDDLSPVSRTWRQKFGDAFRGFKRGVRGQSSFAVHFFFAASVVAAALAMGMSTVEWCLLGLSIAVVLTAEMFNTALECLAKAITTDYNSHIRDALDIGSAAVLLSACGAAVVGLIVFGARLAALLMTAG